MPSLSSCNIHPNLNASLLISGVVLPEKQSPLNQTIDQFQNVSFNNLPLKMNEDDRNNQNDIIYFKKYAVPNPPTSNYRSTHAKICFATNTAPSMGNR
jgi:hypothetical protein